MAQINGLVLPFQIPAIAASIPTRLPMAFPPLNRLPWLVTLPTKSTPPLPGPTPPVPVPNKINGLYDERNQISPWFDMAHALPRRIDLGRILATTNIQMTVHSAYRSVTTTWNTFVNGAGAGTVLTGPTPPQILSPHESTVGLVLIIGTDGVPVVDDTLDFGFTTGDTPFVPISFSRLVYFPIFPEEGIVEDLGFLTDVLTSKDGTEKRASLRAVPRVTYKLRFRDDDQTMGRLRHFLLGRPGSTYGIPLWMESTVLTSPVAASDLIINVQSTDYRQFVAGGVAVVFRPGTAPDIFQIDSFTQTTITPVNPMVGDFPIAGTIVMPVKLATANNRQSGNRWPINLSQLSVQFDVRDALEDLSDVTAWPTLNGKLLIDDCNALGSGSVREGIAAEIVVLDNETGPLQKYAFVANGRYSTRKQWFPSGIANLWKIRQLLYALRGQQASFYMPTNRDEMIPIADLNSGSDSLSIEYVGYTYVFGNGYRDWIRVTLNDGTVYDREVIATTQNEAGTEEYLQLATNWPATHPLADVARIEFLQNVRLSADTIPLRYEPGRPGARVTVPVISVLDE